MDDLGSGFGRAWSINDAGVIVGHSYEAGGLVNNDKLATVSFDGQSVIKLSTLVDNLTGWTVLSNAYDVNELGQIVGYGTYNGEERAFLLTPTAVPVPAAAWLFGSALGLLGWMRRRRTV
jgi:probable HAF family extracellular repeat protein